MKLIMNFSKSFSSAVNRPSITHIEGEDRSFGGNLFFIDLIPYTCWFTSIRSSIMRSDWDQLR